MSGDSFYRLEFQKFLESEMQLELKQILFQGLQVYQNLG
ncbi:hypothetical protein KPSA3_04722 [Pseudomonas syringae pv. actinidiae]|uniref:Uncharacterized protein n=1 Tax=Pseudomonas syringae pv. actinidiae TaxID=103796 RepID=A0AAN4Q7Q3_PSESF|nr:hypothetical protein KPSA3_04722 [Pseudomonas syringae pv. actinidiae]